MDEPSRVDLPSARKVHAAILKRLAAVGQVRVAEMLDVSEATVSRLKSEHLETFAHFLAALGLKAVPADHQCFHPDYIAHLRYFAQYGLSHQTPPTLEWEGDE